MWKRKQLNEKRKNKGEKEAGNESKSKHATPITLMDRMPSPFIPVVVVTVDLVLSSEWRTTSLAWKSPKVPLEKIATLRFSIPFSGVTAVLKYRMKSTITLPGLKEKSTTTVINK